MLHKWILFPTRDVRKTGTHIRKLLVMGKTEFLKINF